MPKAKCRYCGKLITPSFSYKVTVNGRNMYYCNEAEYNTVQKLSQARTKVLDICSEILNRPVDSMIGAEVAAWLNIADYNKISSFLVEHKDYIIKQLERKTFTSAYGQTRYFSAIVKNGLPVYKMPSPEIQKDPPEMCEVKPYNYSRKRKCLSEILESEDIGE